MMSNKKQAVDGRPPWYVPAQACNGSPQWQPWARPTEPDPISRTRHPAGQPHMPPADWMYATDVRQHHCLMQPRQGHNNWLMKLTNYLTCKHICVKLILQIKVTTYFGHFNKHNSQLQSDSVSVSKAIPIFITSLDCDSTFSIHGYSFPAYTWCYSNHCVRVHIRMVNLA